MGIDDWVVFLDAPFIAPVIGEAFSAPDLGNLASGEAIGQLPRKVAHPPRRAVTMQLKKGFCSKLRFRILRIQFLESGTFSMGSVCAEALGMRSPSNDNVWSAA